MRTINTFQPMNTQTAGYLIIFGIALIVLPGPAFIVIPAGLAILAIEFAWARRWLNKVRGLLPKRHNLPHRKEAV